VLFAALLLSIPTRASRRAARAQSRIVGRSAEEPMVLPRRVEDRLDDAHQDEGPIGDEDEMVDDPAGAQDDPAEAQDDPEGTHDDPEKADEGDEPEGTRDGDESVEQEPEVDASESALDANEPVEDLRDESDHQQPTDSEEKR
jgi:hypothetical protein